MKIGIFAANGKMGQDLLKQIDLDDRFILASAYKRSIDSNSIYTNDLDKFCKEAEIIIDFSKPDASINLIEKATQYNKPIVCGTTGFSKIQFEKITNLAKNIPILYSENMSLAVNIISLLAEISAKKLYDNYDIEILEMHHNQKIDSPSGTAIMLGKNIAKTLDIDFETHKVLNRNEAKEARKKGSIGLTSIRGGSVIGEHKIIFAGSDDIIEITHKAISRSIYSKGALNAALWIKNKQPNLYSIKDVLSNEQ